MTVAELRAKLSALPDDLPVMGHDADEGEAWWDAQISVGRVVVSQWSPHDSGEWRQPYLGRVAPSRSVEAVVIGRAFKDDGVNWL